MKVTAIYPGTFDPITNGHIDIIMRSLKSFEHIIVGIGPNPKKTTLFSLEERLAMVKECLSSVPNVSVKAFDGLLVDFAKKQNASVIIRGLRALSDFEYEFQMALMNRKLDSDIETVLADVNNLPFSSESFDIVLATFMIVHIKDLNPVFDEIYRVLKNKGRFILSNINQKKAPKLRLLNREEIVIRSFYHMPKHVIEALESSLFTIKKEEFVYEDKTWVNQIIEAVKWVFMDIDNYFLYYLKDKFY